MTPSQDCIDLIKSFESLKLAAYPDPGTGGEPWTIGYGHTGGVKRGDVCGLAQAQSWLASDVKEAADGIRELIQVPVTQGQFDAMTSFAFNVGVGAFMGSTMLRQLNGSHYNAAGDEFPKWCHSGGHILSGLVKRRAAEQAMFLGQG